MGGRGSRMTQRKTLRNLASVCAVALLSLVTISGPASARPDENDAQATKSPAVSADIESTRTVAGTGTQRETKHLVRDSLGRTRTESGSVVTIADPNTGTTTTLDTRAHTYVTSKAPAAAKP